MHKHLLLMTTLLLTTGGCSTYYRITDTHTGQTYYTRSHTFFPLAGPTPTSLTFTDLQTGDVIWLPSPGVAEIPKQMAMSAMSSPANESSDLVETASFTGVTKP